MGPESAKSCPRREFVAVQGLASTATAANEPVKHIGRAIQQIDYGRRGKGYLFGAFKPADGEALTAPYAGRTTANYVAFLEPVEA
jgi:hypothetical protein